MTDMNGDWVRVRCGEMILLELDYALGAYLFAPNRRYLNDEQIALFRALPGQWLQDASRFLPGLDECMMVFEVLGMLDPAVLEMEYAQASDRLRGLSAEGLREQLGDGDIPWDVQGMILLILARQALPYAQVFQEYPQIQRRYERTAQTVAMLIEQPRMLRAFWAWVDQFMYNHYLPWREKQGAVLRGARDVLAGLDCRDGRYALGALLERLPKTNALHYRAPLRTYLLDGSCELVLWEEPFGLFDSWSVLQGRVLVSVAAPGALFATAREEIAEIAEKSSALGDPTRLGILRLIRHFDMDITELAEYFGLSKPTVSVHVKKLREAGLVTSYPDGNSLRHKLNTQHLQALFEELEGFLDLAQDDPPPDLPHFAKNAK